MNATLSFFLLLAAAAFQSVPLFLRREGPLFSLFSRLGRIAVLLSFFWLIAVFVWRSVIIGFPALTGTYEGLLFFSAAIAGGSLFLRDSREPHASATVRLWVYLTAAALLALASSPIAPSAPSYPVPALRSAWLVFHVAFSFLGEAAFAVSFGAALSWFILKRPESRKRAEAIAAASVAAGYPLYTIGALLFGAIWAQYAWGRFWGWDPKEVWALVTWLVYTFYLHLRLVRRKSGVFPMLVLVTGFLVTLFTFLGVNLLAVGLHSYR
jgi:ABC-type transport system involved in cytochrome c biogenesis permease subunit